MPRQIAKGNRGTAEETIGFVPEPSWSDQGAAGGGREDLAWV